MSTQADTILALAFTMADAKAAHALAARDYANEQQAHRAADVQDLAAAWVAAASNLRSTLHRASVLAPDLDPGRVCRPVGALTPRLASGLLAEYDAWREDRADLSAAEDDPTLAHVDWEASDDAGCDLASRLADLLRTITATD